MYNCGVLSQNFNNNISQPITFAHKNMYFVKMLTLFEVQVQLQHNDIS